MVKFFYGIIFSMATTKKASTATKKRVSSPKKEETPTAPSSAPAAIKLSKRSLLIGAVILLLAVALYTFRSLFIAATVNGQPISRLAVIQELEKQGGKQTINNLVTKTLIEQEAQKKNVVVSQNDVDDEIKKIEDNLAKQGQKLDQLLQMQGMNRDTLKAQIKTQKMVEKLVGPVKVTDTEVTAYIEANKASLPPTEDEAAQKKNVKLQLEQQKISEKAQALLQKLQQDAKINYLVNY